MWKKRKHISVNLCFLSCPCWYVLFCRLVELQHLPWSNHDVLKVIQNGRLKEHMERISMETIPRLSYLLQRALVRIGREVQRLAYPLGMCSKQEVCSALRIILCPALADSCTKVRLYCVFIFYLTDILVEKDNLWELSIDCMLKFKFITGELVVTL